MGVEILEAWCSNHMPLLLTYTMATDVIRNMRRNFKYEVSWDLEEECGKIVESEWGRHSEISGHMNKVQKQLAGCRNALSKWSTNSVKKRGEAIKEKTELLKSLKDIEGPEHIEKLKISNGELGPLLDQEDLWWKQRAKRH